MRENPLRLVLLVVLLVSAIAYSPPLHRMVRHGWREIVDLFDDRPVRDVLIIGNSRVYYNDIPFMIRDIADAAGDAVHWEVTTLAKPGATFESHWSDPEVHALLARKWDLVILQAESGAQFGDENNQRFHRFGQRLVQEARGHGSPVAVVVGWVYGKHFFEGYPGARERMQGQIQTQHIRFAEDNLVDLINVGRAWAEIESRCPTLSLTVDDNHPSFIGSSIEAMAIYRYLSGGSVLSSASHLEGVSISDAYIVSDEIQKRISQRAALRASLVP